MGGPTLSLELATLIFDRASVIFLISLAVGVVTTGLIIWAGKSKEAHWDKEREAAQERIAKLDNETERLKANNLSLQTVMLPRHVGAIGIDGPPGAKEYFAGFEAFAGTKVFVQAAPDLEAQDLAKEIAFVLSRFGWKSQFIDEKRSHVPATVISEGIRVMADSPTEMYRPDKPEDPRLAWLRAGEALANAFTKAGLGVLGLPVSHGGFVNERTNPPLIPYFDPPLDGVYVQVGARPIGLTIQLMQQKRKAQEGSAKTLP